MVLDMNLTSQNTKRVKVAVVDRGLDCSLPDMECVPGKVGMCESDGWVTFDKGVDRTMWAGIIREKAPEAEIYRVQIRNEGQALVAAIRWGIDQEMDVVNIGFGTTDVTFKNALLDICRKAVRGGTVLVAAGEEDQEVYPTVFPEVIGVDDGRVDAPDGYAYRKHQVIECVVDAQRSFWFNGNRRNEGEFFRLLYDGICGGVSAKSPQCVAAKNPPFARYKCSPRIGANRASLCCTF